ncbi:hypothetical protein L798_10197 [Zootermopsis nevadensis]|uniref:Uncharacterized protein n=1 Tax=Zootermopsis nevadensis TaxID=136037 RepID=A0A067R5D0_ZOONE|nr:hypothetical protein L798_10197 [Zootermopsis nevadensis]
MNGDNKKELGLTTGSRPTLWSKLRSALGHVGLFVTLMIYTAVGGMEVGDDLDLAALIGGVFISF